jgi:protein ImuB
MRTAARLAVVRFPQWPLTAVTNSLEDLPDQVVVVEHHRVVAASATATAEGVRVGMRRRGASSLVPGALVLEADHLAEQRLAETAAAGVDTIASGVDQLAPGLVAFAARGPARHWGGERALAERTVDAVADETGWECQVGIADGPLAALLAADTGRIVRPGRSADYLAPFPAAALRAAEVLAGLAPGASDDLVSMLGRLGIATLGDLAALDRDAVGDRFGADAAALHVLAGGGELHPPSGRPLPQPILVGRECDPPLTRTDQAAFLARQMAEDLTARMLAAGSVATRLRITAVTEAGEELERTWRHGGALGVADIVDRIRWQCDGWLTTKGATLGAIVRLGLEPLQLVPAAEQPAALWGDPGTSGVAAARSFARIQSLRGEDAVLVPVAAGGRGTADGWTLAPWRGDARDVRDPAAPWPGRVPAPSPTRVPASPLPVALTDADGRPLVLDGRGGLSAPPSAVLVGDEATARQLGVPARAALPVTAWSGPWATDERWWDPTAADRVGRLQVLPADGPALLLAVRAGRWAVEGWFD